MGFFIWLGISSRDAPRLPEVADSVRDSGQTFMFGRADSGERLDEKSAMQIATVYACVGLLAETVAGLPLHLYRMKDGTNAKERATEHPLYKLLYRQPNPEMTTPLFLLRCVQIGISLRDLDLVTISCVNDLFAEKCNDSTEFAEIASQEQMDAF